MLYNINPSHILGKEDVCEVISMMEHVKTQIRLLLIILVVIGFFLLANIVPVEAVGDNPPDTSAISKKDTEMIPFYWMVVIVGGCIACTLTYVSWRKYKGEEKNKQTNKDSNS